MIEYTFIINYLGCFFSILILRIWFCYILDSVTWKFDAV